MSAKKKKEPAPKKVRTGAQDPEKVSLDLREKEKSLSVHMSLKEAILLHLWAYSGQVKDEGVKAEIMETRDILKKGLVSIRVKNIDKDRGHWTVNISVRTGYSAELMDQHVGTPWVGLAIAELHGFRKEYLEAVDKHEGQLNKPQHIKTGKHLVSQYLGPVDPQTKLNFAETLERYTRETGLTMGNRPLGWGLNLNVVQQMVTSAILEAFSRDEYQGQITLPKEEVLTDPERGPNYLPAKVRSMGPEAMARKAYKHIPELPTIRLTLAEIVKLAGYDHDRQGDKERVKQAVAHLGAERYLFYWRRKAFTIKNGAAVPDRDSKGEHKWEEVVEDGSLFRVKHVLDEQTKELKYFEISPSAVILDQVSLRYGGNYFLMVPRDLHMEVRKAVGQGQRSTSYTFAFLMYLLADYERVRSHAKKGTAPEHSIAKPWEEIAQRIKMPETVWRRNRRVAVARLEQVYQVAKELGYLKSYRRGADGVDTLELEPSKYYRPKKKEEPQLGSK